jgi:hypothetical protein
VTVLTRLRERSPADRRAGGPRAGRRDHDRERRPTELAELAATLDGVLDRLSAVLRHEQRLTAELPPGPGGRFEVTLPLG